MILRKRSWVIVKRSSLRQSVSSPSNATTPIFLFMLPPATGQQPLHFRNALALPVPGKVVDRSKAAAAHAVHIKPTAQVIDLVLQNPRVPPRSANHLRLAVLVQALDLDLACPGH